MASRTADCWLGARASAPGVVTARTAVTAISAGVLCSGLPYSASSNIDQALGGLKSWLPPARVRLVDDDGLMDPRWYRFFQYLVDVRLGGPAAPSVSDLSRNVIDAKSAAVYANTAAAQVAVQTKANAEALAAASEVIQTAKLPGSAQIPPVVRSTNQLAMEP